MSEALVLSPSAGRAEIERPGAAAVALPAVIADAGPVAVERFLEYFAVAIANGRTRAAYGQAVGQFLAWCSSRGLTLRAIAPLHVAAYIRTHPGSVPTVKQHLAAIRALCDWLVVHQVLPVNPAASVRGPKHVVTKGATPVLTAAETRALLDRIDTGTLVGLRDRALLSVMVFSFARVSAAVGMRRQDYFRQGVRGWLRLHEKGGKRHDVPAHHRAEEAVEAYVSAGGLEDARAPRFQSVDRTGRLSGRPLGRRAVLAMIKRRAMAAGLSATTCCHNVSGDGDHGVPVERGDARARAADRGARVAEDDEAVRPDGGRGLARRDRAHRDLTSTPAVFRMGGGGTSRARRSRRYGQAMTWANSSAAAWPAGRMAIPASQSRIRASSRNRLARHPVRQPDSGDGGHRHERHVDVGDGSEDVLEEDAVGAESAGGVGPVAVAVDACRRTGDLVPEPGQQQFGVVPLHPQQDGDAVEIGYARVSQTDGSQSLDLQRDALGRAGVDAVNVYHDLASGVRDDRPGLDSCLRALRMGDVLVVWKLDRLGRNLAHLVNTVQDLSACGVGPPVLAGQGAQVRHHDRGRTASVFGIFAALAGLEDLKLVSGARSYSTARQRSANIQGSLFAHD